MDTSLKLQLDVRNNAQDLQNYMLDLNNWEEEMKRKESALNSEGPPESTIPPPRNKIKRSQQGSEKNSDKPKKISAYDYSAWDKFDVEKACAEIDENEDCGKTSRDEVNETAQISTGERKSDDSNCESKNFSLIDEAFYEKEMGNNFVKKEQWADAIKCYTNAINLDSSNAIYYANRSLCFLKLRNFKAAETDATTAIQLDNKYVKAYQRRAFARQALGQLVEAKSDYEEILKQEPKNALSRLEINKIDNQLAKESRTSKPVEKKTFNPKNMFKSDESKVSTSEDSQTRPKIISKSKTGSTKLGTTISDSKCKNEVTYIAIDKSDKTLNKNYCSVEKGGDGDKVIPSQSSKPTHDIFKPLPEWCKIVYPVNIPPHKRSKRPLKKLDIKFTKEDEDLISTEAKPEFPNEGVKAEEKVVVTAPHVEEEEDEGRKNKQLLLEVPKTAIQFQKSWKILKNHPQEAYNYLKKIPGSELPQILENSLESDFFSELVTFLASDDVRKEADIVYDFLLGLSAVKRFSSLILFMSEADRKCVKKCLSELEKVKSKEEISQLLRLYELKADALRSIKRINEAFCRVIETIQGPNVWLRKNVEIFDAV